MKFWFLVTLFLGVCHGSRFDFSRVNSKSSFNTITVQFAKILQDSLAEDAFHMTLQNAPIIVYLACRFGTQPVGQVLHVLIPKASELTTFSAGWLNMENVEALGKLIFLGYRPSYGSLQPVDDQLRYLYASGSLSTALIPLFKEHIRLDTFSIPSSLVDEESGASVEDIKAFLTSYCDAFYAKYFTKNGPVDSGHWKFILDSVLKSGLSVDFLKQLISIADSYSFFKFWEKADIPLFMSYMPRLITASIQDYEALNKLCCLIVEPTSISMLWEKYNQQLVDLEEVFDLLARHAPYAFAQAQKVYKNCPVANVQELIEKSATKNRRILTLADLVMTKSDSITKSVSMLQSTPQDIPHLTNIVNAIMFYYRFKVEDFTPDNAHVINATLMNVNQALVKRLVVLHDAFSGAVAKIRLLICLLKLKYAHVRSNGLEISAMSTVTAYGISVRMEVIDSELAFLHQEMINNRREIFNVLYKYLREAGERKSNVSLFLPAIFFFHHRGTAETQQMKITYVQEYLRQYQSSEVMNKMMRLLDNGEVTRDELFLVLLRQPIKKDYLDELFMHGYLSDSQHLILSLRI